MTVVITTIITIGPKNMDPMSPSEAPLLATIRATSPRETIPVPIWIASVVEYLHILAPSAHPRTFVKIAMMTKAIENVMRAGVISGITTLIQILAKKIGDNNM